MKPTQLTRTCPVCGLEKPLSAFLQMTGAQGTTYGMVCATCRSEGKTLKSNTTAEDPTGNSPAGQRIGTKERIFATREEGQRLKNIKDLFIKETKKHSELSAKKFEKIAAEAKAKEDHREQLNQQKFLGKKSPEKDKKPPTAKDQGVEKIRQEEILRQEAQIAAWDLSVPFLDPQSAQIKYQGETFLQFSTWLGSDAPMVKTRAQLYKQSAGTKKEEKSKKNDKPAPIADYVEKNNPSKKR